MVIRSVGIIGAGAMGSGIAQVCAQTGWETVLYDAFPKSLKKGEESILNFWQKGIEKGKTEVEVSSWKANLCTTSDISEASRGMDLIIEAVPEKIDRRISLPETRRFGTQGSSPGNKHLGAFHFGDCH